MSLQLFLAIYVIVNLYAISQVNHWVKRITRRLPVRVVLDLIFVVLALIPAIAAWSPDDPLQPTLESIGDKWIGFLLYLTLAFLIFHLFRIVVFLFGGRGESKDPTTHKPHAPWSSTLVIGLCVLISLTLNVYGNVHAHDVHVKEYNIALEKKTVTSGELKIALIGDLHFGSNSHLDQIDSMVSKINDADPDVVLIAGDIFNGSYDSLKEPQKYIRTLNKLKSRQGVYAVYGDYDVKERLMAGFPVTPDSSAVRDPRMTSFMEDAGFTILEDQTVYVNGVQIVGRLDSKHPGGTKSQGVGRLIQPLDTKMPVVVLQHEPKGLESLANGGADLTLCAGTHNGQIMPLNWIWRFVTENSYGLKRLHGAYSLTTCGIGYTGPPIRVGTHSEVSIINLSY